MADAILEHILSSMPPVLAQPRTPPSPPYSSMDAGVMHSSRRTSAGISSGISDEIRRVDEAMTRRRHQQGKNGGIIATSRAVSNNVKVGESRDSNNSKTINYGQGQKATTTLLPSSRLANNGDEEHKTRNNNNNTNNGTGTSTGSAARRTSFIYRLADSKDLVVYDAKQETMVREERVVLERKLREAETAWHNALNEVAERDERLGRLQRELDGLRNEMMLDANVHAEKMSELEETKAMLGRALVESVERSDAADHVMNDLKTNLGEMQVHVEDQDRLIKELKRTVRSQKNEIVALTSRAATLEKTLEMQTKAFEHMLGGGGGAPHPQPSSLSSPPPPPPPSTSPPNELIVLVDLPKGEVRLSIRSIDNPRHVVDSFARIHGLRPKSIAKLYDFVCDQHARVFG